MLWSDSLRAEKVITLSALVEGKEKKLNQFLFKN